MPSESHDPRDYRVGDIIGKSINSEWEVIIQVRLTGLQHKSAGKIRTSRVVDKVDGVTHEDLVRFYEKAINDLRWLKATRTFDDSNQGR